MIPEPSGPLWDWLQKLVDSTQIFPNVDEDAADRMAAGWKTLETAMADTIAAAQAGNDRMPAVWGDSNGQLYHENIQQALGNEGYQEAVRNFEQMAVLCTTFATNVRQTKNQIWSELIMNAFFFAATFLLPPGIGDLLRWRLAASLVSYFSRLIRAAAELTHVAQLGLGARALSLVGHTAWEGVEEVLTELVAQQLDIWQGARQKVDWTQVKIAGLAGVLGSPMSGGLNAAGKVGRRLVGLPDANRVGSRIPYILQGSGNAFVTNSITSPLSSELSKYLITGIAPDFGHALQEGWFQAGVLGASRVHSVHAGDAMGQSFFNEVREARGMAPYADPHGGPPNTPIAEAQNPGNTAQPAGSGSSPPGAAPGAGAGSSISGGSGSASGGSASGGGHGGAPAGHPGGSPQDAHADRHVQPNRQAPSDQQHDDQHQDVQHQDEQQDEQVADQQAPDAQRSPELADAAAQHAVDSSPPGGPPAGDAHTAPNDVPPGGADSAHQSGQGEHVQPHAEQPGAQDGANTGQDVSGSVAPATVGTAAPAPAVTQVTGAGSHLAGQGSVPTGVQPTTGPTGPSTIAPVQKADPADTVAPVAQSNNTAPAAPRNDVPQKPGKDAATEESDAAVDVAPAAEVDPNVVTPGGAALVGAAQAQAAALPSPTTEESNDAPKPLPAHTTATRSEQSDVSGTTETTEDPGEVLAQDGDNVVRRTLGPDGKPVEVRVEFRGAGRHGAPRTQRTNPFSWVAGKLGHRDIVPSGTQFQMWAFHTMQQQLAALARAGHTFDLVFRAVQNAETGITELHAEVTLFRAGGEVVHVAQTSLAEAATSVRRGTFETGHPPAPRTAPGDLNVGESATFRPRVIDVRTAIPDDLVANPESLDALHERLSLLEKAGLGVRVEVTRVPRPTPDVDGVRLTVEVTHPKGKHTFGPSTLQDLVQNLSPTPNDDTTETPAPAEHLRPVLNRAVSPPPGPQDPIPVTPAEGQSVEQAAMDAFVERLNERAPDGVLTPAAEALRARHYQTPVVSKATGEPTGKVNRRSERDTFTAVLDDGSVVEIQVPGLKYLIDSGNFGAVEVVPAVKKAGPPIDVRLDGPILDRTPEHRRAHQRDVDVWNASREAPPRTKRPKQPKNQPVVVDETLQDELPTPQDAGWTMGENFADLLLSWLGARNPGVEEVHRVFADEYAGSGRFDKIFIRLERGTGRILGFAIGEAKSVNGALGSRRGAHDLSYQQGHREYIRSILEEMIRRGGRTAVLDNEKRVTPTTPRELGQGPIAMPAKPHTEVPLDNEIQVAEAMLAALDAGEVEFFMVKPLLENGRTAVGISITEFDLTPPAVARGNQDVAENGGGLERTAETVEEIAAVAGVDLSGIDVVIVTDPVEIADLDHDNVGASAMELADGTVQIRLGPASFADRETLAATLAHEKTHADQFRAGRPVDEDSRAELEREAYASEAAAVERIRAHDRDQIHDRDDVRPAEPGRDHDARRAPERGGPGRHGPPDRGDGPGRDGDGRGTPLHRRIGGEQDPADDGSQGRGTPPPGDGSHQPGLTPDGPGKPKRNEVLVGENGEVTLRIRHLHPAQTGAQPSDPSVGGARRLIVGAMLAGWGAFRSTGEGPFPADARVVREDFVQLEEAVESAVRRGLEVDLTFAMNPDTKWLEASAHVTDPTTGESVTYRRAPVDEIAGRLRPTVARTASGTGVVELGAVGDSVRVGVTESGLPGVLPAELVGDAEALSRLEARWAELVRAGYQVEVTVTKVAGRHAVVDALEFTVEVTDPHSTVEAEARDVYGPAAVRALVEQMITDQQSPGGRHRQAETAPTEDPHRTPAEDRHVIPAAFDPAGGPVAGEVRPNDSANWARWSFGTPGRADEVVLELSEVLPPERLLNPGGKSEALPRIPFDWAFARDRARGLIPPGVVISQQEFEALEQRVQQLIADGHVVSVRLRVLNGRLVVDAYVREAATARSAVHEDLLLVEMVVALDNQVLVAPHGVAEVAVRAAVVNLSAIHLQDGGVRVTTADGRQVVIPAETLARITAEVGRSGATQQALDAEAVRRFAEHLGEPSAQPAQSPTDVLRAAAHRSAAAEVTRRAQELSGGQQTPNQDQEGQGGRADGRGGRAGGGRGRLGFAPRVRGTGFVADGRGAQEGELTVDRVLAAVDGVLASDLGGLSLGDPAVVGQLVVVASQHFQVRVGRVRRGKVASTEVRAGTAQDPHVVTFAPGVADSQLARVWVHELSHTLQELRSPEGGPLRRLWGRLTGTGPNACVDAQFNEFRYLLRQWAMGDRPELRRDIEGLVNAIRERGYVPPTLPWNTPLPLDPRADLKAAIARQLTGLDETIAALDALIASKETAAKKADQEARKKTTERDEVAKDNGAVARSRAAAAEVQKQTELAAWHRQIAGEYRKALARLIAARAGYVQLLQNVATAASHRLVAEAHKFAAEVAAYQTALKKLAPPAAALPSMQPTGRLPHLTALTERLNATLVANGIDHAFTTNELQQLLSAEFGRVLTGDGVVLRVGTKHPADVRIKLSVDELVEVRDPKVKASEIINGLFPQGGRRLATTATSRFGTAWTVPLKALLHLVGMVTHQPWISDLTLKGELSTARTRSVTGNAAEYAQTGAVEDNRGESVLYAGKASWQLDVRTDRTWSAAETIAEGNAKDVTELRAWVSHAYTVDAAQAIDQRLDLANGRLPAHFLTSVTGLEELTDDVIKDNQKQFAKLGSDRTQVEEQLHAVLTNDLPSRLAESTDHAVLRPLTVDGKPVGYVEVTTRIRYEKVKLVGAQSTAHWQESVRIGFSTTSTQQTFGASASMSAKAGYDGAAVHDIDPDGTDVGPTVSGGRTASRSEALSGGGTSIHVGVHRFTGPTQAYSMELVHSVKVVLDGEAATTPGDSKVVARVRVKDAYRYGLPVDRSAVHNGGQTVDGEIDPKAVVPGRKLEFPAWAKDAAGRLNAAGPWNVQAVTGGQAAFEAIMARLAGRGFVPPLDRNGNPDLTKLSADPIERQAQLLNIEELREQLSTERLEAGYDIAVRDGILITLTHARTTQATESVVLRIGIEPHGTRPIGVTNDEAVVLLNIGSETAGRSASRSKGWPWRADPLSVSSTSGLDGKASLSYGRQALGRVLAWFTGGTVNQVTLIESTSPVAVFEVQHTLSVSEGTETFHASAESAHLLIDSDLLPYDDALPPTPPSGSMRPSVLQRMTLLALGAADFTAKLPKAIRNEATALQQLGVFLNPRNLLAHPEWIGAGYSTTLLVPGIGGVSRRIRVSITGRLQNSQLVAVTEGVSGDINLALGSHGAGTGTQYGGSTQASAGVSENSAGGGFNASLGTNGSTSRTDQDIWGVERLTIETGRHYVFTAETEVSLAVGKHPPTESTVGAVFQLAEREALRFYAQRELALPLQQVADAVERFLHGHLKLDRRAASGLLRQYLADLAATRRSGMPVPALSAEHTAQALAAKLRPSPRPLPVTPEQRLAEVVREEPSARIDLPEHYREHLGFSLIESMELDANNELLAEVYDVLRSEFGVDPVQDPALAQALFVDLAGKHWSGRLEDMLGRSGFVRTYTVGRPGELSAEQVTLRIRAEFADEAHELGEAKDVVGIVQRYLYGDRSRSRGSGRSTGFGANGSADAAWSGSAGTDRSEGTSSSTGDQVTRLERIAGFDGMTRVGRRMRLRIEAEHVAGAPARTPLGRRVSQLTSVTSQTRELTGTVVQLIPTAALGRKVPSVPVIPGEVELPSLYHVDGVGTVDGRADLFDVVVDELTDEEMLGVDGVRAHLAEIENKLSASARNGKFSRMASEEGFTLAPLEVPGFRQDTVEVTIRARVSTVEVVSAPFAGQLGEVTRHQETASTTTATGRMLPVAGSGTYAAFDASGSIGGGDQVSDATTDLRGARGERSHFGESNLVTVRVRVAYDLTLTRTHHTRTGTTRHRSTTHIPAAATGRAYLTLYESDHQTLTSSPTPLTPPTRPTPPTPQTPPTAPTRPAALEPPTVPMPPDPRDAPAVPTPPGAGPRFGGGVSSRWRPIHTGESGEEQRRAE